MDDEQWQELGDLAVTEGLEGLLYHRCASEGVEVPAEVYYTWRTGYWVWATDNFAALQALKSVLAELVRQGVEAIVLPGVPLLAFYPDPGCRPMDDIDLLVRPEQMPIAAVALVEMGFATPERHADLYVRGALVIDLHDDLFHCGPHRRSAPRRATERGWALGRAPDARGGGG